MGWSKYTEDNVEMQLERLEGLEKLKEKERSHNHSHGSNKSNNKINLKEKNYLIFQLCKEDKEGSESALDNILKEITTEELRKDFEEGIVKLYESNYLLCHYLVNNSVKFKEEKNIITKEENEVATLYENIIYPLQMNIKNTLVEDFKILEEKITLKDMEKIILKYTLPYRGFIEEEFIFYCSKLLEDMPHMEKYMLIKIIFKNNFLSYKKEIVETCLNILEENSNLLDSEHIYILIDLLKNLDKNIKVRIIKILCEEIKRTDEYKAIMEENYHKKFNNTVAILSMNYLPFEKGLNYAKAISGRIEEVEFKEELKFLVKEGLVARRLYILTNLLQVKTKDERKLVKRINAENILLVRKHFPDIYKSMVMKKIRKAEKDKDLPQLMILLNNNVGVDFYDELFHKAYKSVPKRSESLISFLKDGNIQGSRKNEVNGEIYNLAKKENFKKVDTETIDYFIREDLDTYEVFVKVSSELKKYLLDSWAKTDKKYKIKEIILALLKKYTSYNEQLIIYNNYYIKYELEDIDIFNIISNRVYQHAVYLILEKGLLEGEGIGDKDVGEISMLFMQFKLTERFIYDKWLFANMDKNVRKNILKTILSLKEPMDIYDELKSFLYGLYIENNVEELDGNIDFIVEALNGKSEAYHIFRKVLEEQNTIVSKTKTLLEEKMDSSPSEKLE
ncbi:hypothetical protein [uncultured Clostridium sp.]|uniref:hypothetical protein n=1 Tax=uncultured Clostridium sp. TaxID=59620 RepID=UPI0028EEAFC5|nr:hypothetical protein [uncultured Clostridium sp.]